MSKLTVTKVVDDGDRKLLYGHWKWDNYHIICNPNEKVKIGDIVEYEPEGINFGWFKGVVGEQGKG